jgi:hypothetical protein
MAQPNMSRMEAVDRARRIQDLPVGEQAKLLARVMLAEGTKVPPSAIRAIQRRSKTPRKIPQISADTVEQQVVQTVRAVRHGRARIRRI